MTTFPKELDGLVQAAIQGARTWIEDGREIPGLALIDTNMEGTNSPAVLAVPMATFGKIRDAGKSKDAWRRMVATVASFTEARFVLVVSEVWYLDKEHVMHRDAILKRYGSLQNAPMATEGITVIVETRNAGSWMGLAPIITAPSGKKTFGHIKLEMHSSASGRLAGFLGGAMDEGRPN